MSITPTLRKIEGFRVVGYSVRTSNPEEAAGAGRIADLWRRFSGSVHELGDGPPVAVYDSYESDHLGKYTITVGSLATDDARIPDGGSATEVESGDYLVYPVPAGEMPHTLIATWQQVWGDFTAPDFPYRRTFVCDFEVHTPEGDLELTTELFIGVERVAR